MKLSEVLDDELTERMLLQHDRYEFGCYVVQRDRKETRWWWCYYGPLEMHVAQNPGVNLPQGFRELADALDFCLSPRQQELCEEYERIKP